MRIASGGGRRTNDDRGRDPGGGFALVSSAANPGGDEALVKAAAQFLAACDATLQRQGIELRFERHPPPYLDEEHADAWRAVERDSDAIEERVRAAARAADLDGEPG
jgi:hypothetical protein